MWQIYSLRDQTCQSPQAQHQTDTYARGLLLLLWNQYTDSIVAMKKRYKFIHKTKDKIWGQNITQRRYKMHNLHTSYVYTKHAIYA